MLFYKINVFQTFTQKPVHLDNIQTKIKERHAELLAMDKVICHKSMKVRSLKIILNIINKNRNEKI